MYIDLMKIFFGNYGLESTVNKIMILSVALAYTCSTQSNDDFIVTVTSVYPHTYEVDKTVFV